MTFRLLTILHSVLGAAAFAGVTIGAACAAPVDLSG